MAAQPQSLLYPQILLRVLDGPLKGTRIPVRDGLTLGRKEGDVILKDSKLSNRHARIERKSNEWLISDLGSANKIKVDGTRYAEVVLYPGLQFTIGSTPFEVLEHPKTAAKSTGEPVGDIFEFTGSMEVPAEELSWKEILLDTLNKVRSQKGRIMAELSAVPLRPFPSVVKLEFLSGPQHGTHWNIGYGPREIGADSFDLSLIDEASPGSCFHLDTLGGKIMLRASAHAAEEGKLRLNGKLVSTLNVELRSGDRIEIGKTRIRVVIG